MSLMNSRPSTPEFTPSAYGIDPNPSTGFVDIEKFIETKFEAMNHGGSQYLSLSNVSEEAYQELESKREERSLPRMRVQYFPDHSTLIIKLAGVFHETACDLVFEMMLMKFHALGISSSILRPCGAGRQRMVAGVSKESDKSWLPRETRS